jgi:hypothetical protein
VEEAVVEAVAVAATAVAVAATVAEVHITRRHIQDPTLDILEASMADDHMECSMFTICLQTITTRLDTIHRFMV